MWDICLKTAETSRFEQRSFERSRCRNTALTALDSRRPPAADVWSRDEPSPAGELRRRARLGPRDRQGIRGASG